MFLQIYASEIWVRNISMLLTFVYKPSGISVNKGTNLRLGWTEYSERRPYLFLLFVSSVESKMLERFTVDLI